MRRVKRRGGVRRCVRRKGEEGGEGRKWRQKGEEMQGGDWVKRV